mmetsp:Transcript_25484/g.59044  ORF Transcript_25484/g.59044 Transcript_25484/m.59044 type:complete len:171 (+) Transcript_25484:104-616(+)
MKSFIAAAVVMFVFVVMLLVRRLMRKGGAGARKKLDVSEKNKTSNENLDSLEGGFGGGQGAASDEEDWGDWNKPAAPVPTISVPLQKLDDFDGTTPPSRAQDLRDAEPDYFSNMQFNYVPPPKVDRAATSSVKKPVVGMDDEIDIDLDSWEAGNAATKKKKKGLGGTKIS